MFKFFQSITDLIEIVWGLIKTSFSVVVSIFQYIFNGFVFIVQIIDGFPPFAKGFIMFILAFALISVLVGQLLDY